MVIKINGIAYFVEGDWSIYQVCQELDLVVPRFCYCEGLTVSGNCRMCLVEMANAPKPVASCAMPLGPNMEIYTNSPLLSKAREAIMEFELLNHPLDCPICDQGGECDLQDESINFGSDHSRMYEMRTGVANKNYGPFIKLIMTRCIRCTRCVRFTEEIAPQYRNMMHDGLLNLNIKSSALLGTTTRGESTEIGMYIDNLLNTEFSGNIVDLCPVGALTNKTHAFTHRPWEIDQTIESLDLFDASGNEIRIDLYNGHIVRILPNNPDSSLKNNRWINDKTRYSFDGLNLQRIVKPAFQSSLSILKEKENILYKKDISWNNLLFDIYTLFNQYVKGNLISTNIHLNTNLNNETLIEINKYIKNTLNKSLLKNNNKDIQNRYLLNANLNYLNKIDFCLLININPRTFLSSLNVQLMDQVKKNNLKIAYIGTLEMDLGYPVHHLGNNLNNVLNLLKGHHKYTNYLFNAKNPLIISSLAKATKAPNKMNSHLRDNTKEFDQLNETILKLNSLLNIKSNFICEKPNQTSLNNLAL